MKITDEMIDYIGILARLKVHDNEKEGTKDELNKMLDYMDILNELDTTNTEAMSHTFPVKNVFRDDEIQASVDRDMIVLNAPEKKDGCIKVPKTVD